MTEALALSRSGSDRIVLAWVRFTLRRDFTSMTVASARSGHKAQKNARSARK